jgi:hypothetical protein
VFDADNFLAAPADVAFGFAGRVVVPDGCALFAVVADSREVPGVKI